MSEIASLLIGAALGLLGAIIGAAVVSIWVETRRSPRLQLLISTPNDWLSRPGEQARTLQLSVGNAPSAKWITRQAAERCRALVTFHREDGSDFFQGAPAVEGRWASTPEPAAFVVGKNESGQAISFSSGYTLYTDIYPDESEPLDIVIRYADEADCYVWNNDTYKYSDRRNPNWKIARGSYFMKVTVIFSGGRKTCLFHLMNDGARQNFHLLPVTDEQRLRFGL
jgi:hypothetical protein